MQILVKNKKASFDYEIKEQYEAGIELFGFEVKALRKKGGNLVGAHVIVRGGEAFLVGADIPPYQPNNTPKEYEADRNRKLLLTKKEIAELSAEESKKGLTIVPLALLSKTGIIKLSLAVVKAKKKHDKREVIKRRDVERDIRRSLKTE